MLYTYNYSNISALAVQLYTEYVYPFELAAVLLLIAIIAAITLVHRPGKAKKQNISQQVAVSAKDRLRVWNKVGDKPKRKL